MRLSTLRPDVNLYFINKTPKGDTMTDAASTEIAPADLDSKAENIVKSHAMVAMAGGLVPFPLVDVAVLVSNQVKMIHSLSKLYDVPFKEVRVRSTVIALLGGAAPVAGVMGMSALKIIPGIGTLIGSGGVSVTGGALTYAVGRSFIRHFEGGGDTRSFDLQKMRNLFRRELKAAKDEVAETESTGKTTVKGRSTAGAAPATA